MMHIDSLNPTGPNKILFTGQARVCPTNHALVSGAHWRIWRIWLNHPCVAARRRQCKNGWTDRNVV